MATAVRTLPQSLPSPLLRLRSDEQLLVQFRAGREEAFRLIHERYHERLLAYVRHMLRGHADAEDVVQDVFERAYHGLRAGQREIAVRPWLYRVAHNRCIDYVRRAPTPPLQPDELLPGGIDPVAAAERREDLRRLVADLHNLPEQQRSALIIRELEGLSYGDLATTLGVTVPAVKSLLVRARTGLAEAAEARDADCADIREQLALAVDRPGRPPRLLRDHLRTCPSCRAHRQALRHGHAQLASVLPGPSSLLLGGWLATLLGGSGGGSSAAAGSTLAAGATKALAVASASVAVAGGAAEVAHKVRPSLRHVQVVAAKSHHDKRASHAGARTGAPAARSHMVPVKFAATPGSRPARRVTAGAPAAAPAPVPVASGPAEEAPAPEPTATPEATETPTPSPTPEATPEATPEPEATAEVAADPATTPAATP